MQTFKEILTESKNWKAIIDEHEKYGKIKDVQLKGNNVIVISNNIKEYKYKHKEVAKEVYNKIKNFIGL